jgi:hypothetical protein
VRGIIIRTCFYIVLFGFIFACAIEQKARTNTAFSRAHHRARWLRCRTCRYIFEPKSQECRRRCGHMSHASQVVGRECFLAECFLHVEVAAGMFVFSLDRAG